MREIRFRGRRVDNGEWVYGSYTHCQDGDGHTTIIPFRANYHVPVDPETVGQYTGLKNRSGVEIYEGDVVKGDMFEKIIGKVAYSGTRYVVHGVNKYLGIREELFGSHEVIGNIHEHPHLLKGEQE